MNFFIEIASFFKFEYIELIISYHTPLRYARRHKNPRLLQAGGKLFGYVTIKSFRESYFQAGSERFWSGFGDER
jgi:hypothetical protein